jgi:hypothetical protein
MAYVKGTVQHELATQLGLHPNYSVGDIVELLAQIVDEKLSERDQKIAEPTKRMEELEKK